MCVELGDGDYLLRFHASQMGGTRDRVRWVCLPGPHHSARTKVGAHRGRFFPQTRVGIDLASIPPFLILLAPPPQRSGTAKLSEKLTLTSLKILQCFVSPKLLGMAQFLRLAIKTCGGMPDDDEVDLAAAPADRYIGWLRLFSWTKTGTFN